MSNHIESNTEEEMRIMKSVIVRLDERVEKLESMLFRISQVSDTNSIHTPTEHLRQNRLTDYK